MTQVQDSSDCCINSKFSSAKKGYFEDDYLSLFIKKFHPRSPIINRGYYIRFKAMEEVFHSWWSFVDSSTCHKFQIISLGAGYDSSYIRLKRKNQLPPHCHFIEVDFLEVMKKKYEKIKSILKPSERISSLENPAIVLHSEEYSLLGVDLTDISSFEKILTHIGINYNSPTLFFSECSIVYIDAKDSENFISWVQKKFPNSTFVTYEQVYPWDAFGIIMRNHFSQVACALKSITKYPTEESQVERFKKLGWPVCSVITMYELFNSLPKEEKHRIQQLEMFDEYEMWHEKCHHYILLYASQGILSHSLPTFLTLKNAVVHPQQYIFSSEFLKWRIEDTLEAARRFGHQVVPLNHSIIIISGGFGLLQKKHQRLGDIVLYHVKLKKCIIMCLKDKNHLMGKRMFYSMTLLSNNTIVILGGRSSPKKVFREVLILQDLSSNSVMEAVFSSDETVHYSTSLECTSISSESVVHTMPVPTWRHSATLVEVEGIENIVVFGGCSQDAVATNGCFILNTKTWQWTKVSLQENTPCERHSHSAVCYNKSYVIITGGLTADENILDSIHIFDCKSLKWSIMSVSGLLPRYSHTSHIWRDHLYLVGGITNISKYNLGIGVVDLKTLQASEILVPPQNPEYPILMSNHSSFLNEDDEIVIVGGGGNCFSFGTHFNQKIVPISLKLLT